MDIGDVGTAVAAVTGVLVLLGAITYGTRGALLRATNELLERSLQQERAERVATEERCNQRIAHLEGKVATLTTDHARTVAHAVIGVMREEGVIGR